MLSRRRFFAAVAGAAVAAPVAVAAAPAVEVDAVAYAYRVVNHTFYSFGPRKIGDTIMVRMPIRFKPLESHVFTWSTDEILPVTMATAEELEAFHADERRRAGLNF